MGFDDVGGPLLGLVEDAADIFADDAEREKLHSAKEEDAAQQRGEAGDGFAVEYGLADNVDHIGEREQRYYGAHDGGYAQRSGGVGCDAFNREVEQRAEIERRLPLKTVGCIIIDGFLAETHPAVEAFGVALRLAQRHDGLDNAAVEQAEVADVLKDFDSCGALKQAVVSEREPAAEETFATSRNTRAIHVVVALQPPVDHERYCVDGMLEVSVDYHDGVSGAVVHAGEHGGLLAEIAREVDDADARVVSAQLVEQVECTVAAAVVDKQEFPPEAGHVGEVVATVFGGDGQSAVGEGREAPEQRPEVLLLIVGGNENGNFFQGQSLLMTWTTFIDCFAIRNRLSTPLPNSIRRATHIGLA